MALVTRTAWPVKRSRAATASLRWPTSATHTARGVILEGQRTQFNPDANEDDFESIHERIPESGLTRAML